MSITASYVILAVLLIRLLLKKSPKKYFYLLWSVVLFRLICPLSFSSIISIFHIKPFDMTAELYGNYVFEKQLYMNPLSSFLAFDGFIEYYTLTKNFLIITDMDGNQQRISVDYEKSELDEEEFKNSFFADISVPPDISAYKERFQYTLKGVSAAPFYRIYCLDNEIWFAKINRNTANLKMNEYIWSIYRIKPYNEEPPMRVAISGNHFGVETFLTLQQNNNTNDQSDYASDTCYNITPDIIKESSEYKIFKYNTSSASFLQYEDTIYPLGIWFGGYGVTSMALADMDEDEMPELYFTYSWGSGLHRSHVAYFNPKQKEVVTFDYTLKDKDMMIIDKGDGSLSLYEATIRMENGFSNFEAEKGNFLAEIVTQDGQISLAPVVSK